MKDLFGEEIAPVAGGRGSGSGKGMLRVIGASNVSLTERAEDDFYATPPEAVEMLLGLEDFSDRVVEPCCGMGHIGKVLEAHGHRVDARDLVDRGYGVGGQDFLRCEDRNLDADVVTNPPYSLAQEFVEKSLDVVGERHKVAMFLKLTFLEGKARRRMFEATPPIRIWVSSSRLSCAKNGGEFVQSCICYAWFVWMKGWRGDTVVKWFN